jgi:ABC-type transport system involved in multi-copper enzyme maturation permease subunit
MGLQLNVLSAEMLKIKHSKIVWFSFLAFSIAPLMGGIFIVLLQRPETVTRSAALYAKAASMGFSADWNAYLALLTQAVGVGGILIFGFVASWIFGREYAENTAKDLLSLPTSRYAILNAKFIIYLLWSLALVISNLFIAYIIALFLHLQPISLNAVLVHLLSYFTTTILTLLTGTPLALLAMSGKGYLAPLGFVALTLVLAQIIAATGYGHYFPWSIPGLFSGAAGEYKTRLNSGSYMILSITGLAGYLATLAYWRYFDQPG